MTKQHKETFMNLTKLDLIELENEISNIKQQLLRLPDGNISCESNGKYSKFYMKNQGQKQLIPSKEIESAKPLIFKKYLSLKLADLEYAHKYLSQYITNSNKHPSKADCFLKKPRVKNLIISYLYKDYGISESFFNNACPSKPLHGESLKFQSISGNILRSKSELLIDQALYLNNILYRYEYPITFNDTTLHPDFSIIKKTNGKLIIWEHFGMMDNPTYAQNAMQKINLYIRNGYIPNINLLTTYETLEHPLDNRQIEATIKSILS